MAKIALQVIELMRQSKKTKQIFLLPLLSKTAAVLRFCSGFPSCLVGASTLHCPLRALCHPSMCWRLL